MRLCTTVFSTRSRREFTAQLLSAMLVSITVQRDNCGVTGFNGNVSSRSVLLETLSAPLEIAVNSKMLSIPRKPRISFFGSGCLNIFSEG
jgi:hypothetical protein